ncbi:ankyrin and armadillo repeat-containing protein isoform X6 [Vicugna pacos]|uniref:Ankyrin and armadillo repeat-containing protein isoform X6 n=1 Tax=Vicugna pacos TaxID=30538 RepID=A0ABM5D903_VICPA
MLRLSKKGLPRFDQSQDKETYLENLAVQRNASAFFEKYDRNEVQELLTTALVSWLSAKEDGRSQLDTPCGIMSQMNNVAFSTAILLTPVDTTALLDYREVHQIIRELAIGIYCLNQIPSISLEANYDQSSSCQLPPAYCDTRIGQILISVDYMLKALWHGIYMPKEKRARFSELWRTIMDIDPDGKPQTKRDIFAEFSSAGLIDITKDPDFNGIYDEDMNEDPTYNPNSPEEIATFMKYAENIMLKLTFSTTQVQQYENVFIFETAYWLTNAIKYNQDYLDICTYQRLQQRLYLQKKIIQKHFEKKKEIRKGIEYLKLICFLTPFLLSLKKKMKVPYLSSLLQPFSDDNVKTERELPPFIYGQDFKCQNFHYKADQYFHVHGGIEFDISTPSIENALEDFKNNLEKIRDCAANTFAEESGYREYYSIPVMKFNGKRNQCTPLLLAATSGALDTIQYLLSLGANWRKTDIKGNNIIHLSVLTFHTEVLKHIIELNIPELPVWKTLVEMLQCESYKRRMMAIMSLEVICLANDGYWESILDAGTIPALINLLKSSKIKLQCKTVGLLSNISTHPSVVHSLVGAGAIPALINLLVSEEPELHSRCAVILYDIAQLENKDVIAKHNGIPALINLLNLDIESVLVNVMNCIRVLCTGNENNQRAVRDHKGITYLITFLSSDSDVLKAVSSVTIAEVARGNKEVQDAMAMEGAIPPLVALFKGKHLSVQVKGAMAVEALASYNPAIQRAFLEKSLSKYLLKLLKAFQTDVKEQGAAALWALAGQTLKQQKYMAEQIGYNFIINMLLSPSAKMQYVGGEAVIALSKDSRMHQNQICEGNGIAPLVRLLRISKIAEGTLLSVIKAVGSICIGVAHTSNPISQQFVVDENALPVLIQLLRNHPSPNIKVEVAFSLACIVLRNDLLQYELQEKEGFNYDDVLYLLHSQDKDICLRAGYALTLFAFNNCFQQYLILESGIMTISIFEPFLESTIETEKAMAAFQIIILAKVIIDVDYITLSARGVTILVDSLYSVHSTTIVLTGNLIASLAHSRAGIPEAFTTLGTIQRLCYHLYSGQEEVRMACSSALGYLTYNANAFRILLKECRNKPNQFLRITNNISRDASINPVFLKEFQMQQRVGLPSSSLEKNGGPSIIPVFKKGKEHRRKLKPRIQPRDSLTFRPPVTSYMGLFKTTEKTAVSHNVFSFSSAISSDIIKVSRPRIVFLSQLGKRVQKANPELAEG